MKRLLLFIGSLLASLAYAGENPSAPRAIVIPHEKVQEFALGGITIRALAAKSTGAKQFEIWRSSVPPGSSPPPTHLHNSEEIFIFLKGKGKFIVGGEETEFSAPCTVIAPANVPHAYVNTGEEPTDAIVIIEIDSKIYDADNNVMDFPWRK
jgi:mannose-6-phosphate isomerase-like protein (cupin superfamily)